MINVIDIRNLADEWEAILDDGHPFGIGRRDEVKKYEELCDDLGVERSPGGLRDYGDMQDSCLIAEDDFTEYAQKLAEDIGAIDSNARWPLSYIDWERAANALKVDYSQVEYDGNLYLIRS